MKYVDSLNQGLHELMAEDATVVLLGEDLVDPYGGAFKVTRGLSSSFPGRVVSTPVSEGAIVGVATGMAIRGFRPIVEIMLGDFLTLCVDQIVNGASKFCWIYRGQVTVPLVIRVPMGGRRGYGPTHSQTLEPLFLSVPGLEIVAPSRYHDPGGLLRRVVLETRQPVLFVENKSLYSQPLVPIDSGVWNDMRVQRHGEADYPTISLSLARDSEVEEVTLVAYGGMADLAIAAARNVFMRDELLVEVLVPSRIKPLPMAEVLKSARRTRRLVVAEESVRTGGWASELGGQATEALFTTLLKPVGRIGALELPIPSSRPLEDQVLPQVSDIETALYQQVS